MSLRVQASLGAFGPFWKPLSLPASGHLWGSYRLIVMCGFSGCIWLFCLDYIGLSAEAFHLHWGLWIGCRYSLHI